MFSRFYLFLNFFKFFKILSKKEFLGDAVIIKSTWSKFEPSDDLKDFIQQKKHVIPDFSDIDFSTFPSGSFGEAYHRYMMKEKLTPFRFSGKYQHLMSQNYLAVYYASVHDFIHVLTGFDTSYAGETAVWGFVAGQNISPKAKQAYHMARWFFPLICPWQWNYIHQLGHLGFKMGQDTRPVIKINFRDEFHHSLQKVREKYHIINFPSA